MNRRHPPRPQRLPHPNELPGRQRDGLSAHLRPSGKAGTARRLVLQKRARGEEGDFGSRASREGRRDRAEVCSTRNFA